jgi:hypothetical protein
LLVGELNQVICRIEYRGLRVMRCRDVCRLNLRNHDGPRHIGGESTSPASHTRPKRRSSDDTCLLNRHRHQRVFAINLEIRRNPDWILKRSDNVLAHGVRTVNTQFSSPQ